VTLRVGIVGCGKIADEHVFQIKRIPGCEIVGVCDREELMAKQLSDRFKINGFYNNIDELVEKAEPQVIHITTPPQSHYELGMRALDAGCHVLIEKPFTVTSEETKVLIRQAERKDLKITVDHDEQFSHVAVRMREMIQKGYLGGPPVHMESYYGYDLGNQQYARALLGDRTHWIRQLPGTLLQNNISHGIARIAEYIQGEHPEVTAQGFTSDFLRDLGEDEIIDELRVMIRDGRSTTAYFTFSSRMRPALRAFRVYGERNALMMDHDQQTLIGVRGDRFKSYLEKFIPPYLFAKQYVSNAHVNMKYFLKNDFHMKSGMKFLFESFYQSIRGSRPVPIPYREIILTSRIMDDIFGQLKSR
jgi:predicted dehydrogenase